MADSAAASGDRDAVLAKRRELRKAKKAKGREFKVMKKRDREEKKQQIQAKIREKREAERLKAQGKTNENACWLCGQGDHRKQDCPNRAVGDISKTCFKCRRRGHTSYNCPSNGDGSYSHYGENPLTANSAAPPQRMVCFNCGSGNHALRDCREPRVNGGATYATCFVCNQTGHLSSQCPQSTTGIYPKGGCCKVCKSVDHLARDCPAGKISVDGGASARHNKKKTFDDVDEGDTGGDALDSYDLGEQEDNGDGDDDYRRDDEKAKQPPKKKSRTVKF